MKSGDVIGLLVLGTVLVLLLKNPEGTARVIQAGSTGVMSTLSVLQGNTPTGVTYQGFATPSGFG